MANELKYDGKKNCWTCKYFSTSPNWAPVGSGSCEYSCFLYGGSHIRKIGSGMSFCDAHEPREKK
jgi:hypothetical protein